jgi:hypothetical protein
MKKRIFSRVLALVMALSLLSTTAFAASFSQLQDAIDGQGGQMMDNGHTGYAWNEGLNHWGIEAWDDGDNRNVQLNENVEYAGTGDSSLRANLYIGAPGGTDSEQYKISVSLDLNGYSIDGGNNNSEEAKQSNKNNIIVWEGSELTIEDNSESQTGKITGGDGAVSVYNGSTLNLKSGSITGNSGKAAVNAAVGSTFNMSGGSISGNHGGGEGANNDAGAGLKASRATVNITGGEISNNDSAFCGSGIHATGSNVTISNATITGNTAIGTDEKGIRGGGGIFLTEGSNLTLSGGNKISGNTANRGGGIFVGYGAALTVTGENEIQNNTATEAGDDIYARDKAASLNLGNSSWRMDNSGNRNENVAYVSQDEK